MREGQREYRVHPAFDGGARTDVLVRDGRFAALYRIAAHNADDGVVFRFQHLKLLFVSEVKGVVFADDGGDAQTAALLSAAEPFPCGKDLHFFFYSSIMFNGKKVKEKRRPGSVLPGAAHQAQKKGCLFLLCMYS